jgi:hypothetical protein
MCWIAPAAMTVPLDRVQGVEDELRGPPKPVVAALGVGGGTVMSRRP